MDESGTITKRYQGGRYFVMAYVLTTNGQALHQCFTQARLEVLKDDVHSVSNLEQQRELKGTRVDEVIKAKIYEELVTFHQNKPSFEMALAVIDNKHLKRIFRKNKARSFNYFTAWAIKLLAETSGFTIDALGTVLLIDDRNVAPESQSSLEDFLNIQLQLNDQLFKHDIHASYSNSKQEQLIQLADWVANTALRALNANSVEAQENLHLLMPLLTGERIFKFGKTSDESIII